MVECESLWRDGLCGGRACVGLDDLAELVEGGVVASDVEECSHDGSDHVAEEAVG